MDDYNGYANLETWLFNNWYGENISTLHDFYHYKNVLLNSFEFMEEGMLKDMIKINDIDWQELEDLYNQRELNTK